MRDAVARQLLEEVVAGLVVNEPVAMTAKYWNVIQVHFSIPLE